MEFKTNLRNLDITKDYTHHPDHLSLISYVEMEFLAIEKKDKKESLVSQRVTIPGIDATWWLEIVPFLLSFPSTDSPEKTIAPEIKLKIEFHNQTIYTSNLFTVTVNIVEWRNIQNYTRRSGYWLTLTNHMKFYDNFTVNINSKSLEVSSESCDNNRNAYDYSCEIHNDLNDKKSKYLRLNLRCKLNFKFIGDFAESFSDAIKMLKNVPLKEKGNLLKDDSFSDFTIIAGDESFKVHKCILANASSAFKTMFTCGLDETKLNLTTFNCKPEIMKHFLKFIYEGALPSNEELKSLEFCFQLYELAQRYDIRILREICKMYALKLTVNEENALKIYEFASTYEIQSLLDSSWEIIKMKLLEIEGPCKPKSLPKIKEAIARKAELLAIYKRSKELLFEDDNEVTEGPQAGEDTQAAE